ncbi:MAG: type IV toxin-antitoxin system AbiEi family antitoxin domain-containing protein [Acidimicrobiia bacterium]
MPVDRRDLRRRLFNLASEQAGYFTAAQAKSLGYSYQAQAHHVASGNWLRIDRGLFRLTEWIPGVHDELSRWTLWSRGQGIVSHESALAVHELGEFESAYVHLTVPPGFRSRDSALVLHHADLADIDIDRRTGYRVTSAVRSIVDVAGTGVDAAQLNRAIREALERGLLSLRALRGRAEAVDPKAALRIERALSGAEGK